MNTVAALVHGAVHLYAGSTNKNIGEAFLLVWKLPKGTTDAQLTAPASAKTEASLADSKSDESGTYVAKDSRITQLADNALVAFLKTIVDVKLALKDGSLTTFANHPGLKKAGWKLSMGFGLHIGWYVGHPTFIFHNQ